MVHEQCQFKLELVAYNLSLNLQCPHFLHTKSVLGSGQHTNKNSWQDNVNIYKILSLRRAVKFLSLSETTSRPFALGQITEKICFENRSTRSGIRLVRISGRADKLNQSAVTVI